MDWANLLYVTGALALGLGFVLNHRTRYAVLPPRMLAGLLEREWALRELALVLAPGLLMALLGLLVLRSYLWPALFFLSVAVLLSALAMWWLAGRRHPLSFARRIAAVFGLYLVVALAAAAPSIATSHIRWTHARGILALATALLVLTFLSAALLLVVAVTAVYLAVVCQIARSAFFAPPPGAPEPDEMGTPIEPESFPPQADMNEPDSRSA